jgi:hypothetical protein
LLITVAKERQTDPFENAILITSQVKDRVGGSSIKKVQTASRTFPHQHKAPYPMPFDASQIILTPSKRKTHQIDESFLASRQMTPQAQQSLAVLAKGIKADCHRPPIRPKDLIALKIDVAAASVFSWIAPK